MGKIYDFPVKGKPDDIAGVMNALMSESGDTKSFMHLIERADGTVSFGIAGGFADRLQFAAFALVKMLDSITDRIAESDSAGYTESPTFSQSMPCRPLPRGLKERTGPGAK